MEVSVYELIAKQNRIRLMIPSDFEANEVSGQWQTNFQF
jgi:hypothetical protein